MTEPVTRPDILRQQKRVQRQEARLEWEKTQLRHLQLRFYIHQREIRGKEYIPV